MKILGREPALLLGFAAAALKLAAAFGLNVSDTQQALINSALAAGVGVWLAIVAKDGALGAAITQLAQAFMALFIGFGLDWTAAKQATVMATLAAVLAMWERTQITAPVVVTALEQKSPYSPSAPRGV
ncbi:hypothetical protein ACWGIU_37550 [Streptomyces sp. NPDC054840]